MAFSGLFNKPFTESKSSVSALVPHPYDMAIDGLPFFIDEQHIDEHFRKESIPITAAQADTGEEPGERSITRKELWRRSVSTWHKGAGQEYYDKPESDRARFRTSRGVDPWTKWQLRLLPDVTEKLNSTNTNLAVLAVGNRFYVADGNVLQHTATLAGTVTWTDAVIQAAEAAASIQSIATDGFNVYAALGANGVHRTDRGATSSSHYSDLQAQLIAYVKGRLMAAVNNVIYNITASGAAPAALFTHPNTDFRWVGFAEGRNAIYAAGFSGDKSLIYRTAVQPDGTALTVPVVAGELTDGEVVRSIQGYLGEFIILGTDLGLRFARTGNDEGDLLIGDLIVTPGPVRCFEPHSRFVWFGYERFDSTHTGLGRLDLRIKNEGETPAYASDLMVDGSQGNVLSIATFESKRVFAVSADGIYRESDNKVASGFVDSGYVTFDLADPKTLANIIVRHSAEDASFNIYLAKDPDGLFVASGVHRSPDVGVEDFPLNQATAERFEIRLELVRNSDDLTEGPLMRGWTLRARPAPGRNLLITVPVKIWDRVESEGVTYLMDVVERQLALESLLKRQPIVPLQLGTATYTVFLDDYHWIPAHRLKDGSAWNGTGVLVMITLN